MSHSPGRRSTRLETGGGWRRTRVREERRWPSFISWRWAGPGRVGWIRCPWRAPPLQLPPPRLRHSTTLMSRRRLGQNPRADAALPARRQPSGRPRNPARRQLGKVPGSPPRGPSRPRRPLGRRPLGRSPRPARALAGLPPGNGPRRAAAGGDGRPSSGSPAGIRPRRS
jgi:hypothetical protein